MSTTENTINLVPRIHYLVALGYIILDRPGENNDEHYVEMIGSFESYEDAKLSVDEHAGLIMDNDEQYLTIYKIDLNQCKVKDFYRKDLPEGVEEALREQREEDAKNATKRKRELESVVKKITTAPLRSIEKINAEGTLLGAKKPANEDSKEDDDDQNNEHEDDDTPKVSTRFGVRPVDAGKKNPVRMPRPNYGMVSSSGDTTPVAVPTAIAPKPKRMT